MATEVYVTGFFDSFHAGHARFLAAAAEFGDLTVGVGTDALFEAQRGFPLMHSFVERAYMVSRIAGVKSVVPVTDSSIESLGQSLQDMNAECHVVTINDACEQTREMCQSLGVRYETLVMPDLHGPESPADAPTRSDPLRMQYRLCLAGGWLDQPWVSSIAPGSVVVVSLEPITQYMDKAGMATSTRRMARAIWGERIPSGNPEQVAKILFGAENPPGSQYVSGSQDALGLTMPGFNRLNYDGDYWPETIDTHLDNETARWFESVVQLIPMFPRPEGYNPLDDQRLDAAWVRRLGESGDKAYDACCQRDTEKLGWAISETCAGYKALFPGTVPADVEELMARYKSQTLGMNITGAGGGGYITAVSETPLEGAVPMKVRLN
jgi:cytidyltransferase-like protein